MDENNQNNAKPTIDKEYLKKLAEKIKAEKGLCDYKDYSITFDLPPYGAEVFVFQTPKKDSPKKETVKKEAPKKTGLKKKKA